MCRAHLGLWSARRWSFYPQNDIIITFVLSSKRNKSELTIILAKDFSTKGNQFRLCGILRILEYLSLLFLVMVFEKSSFALDQCS